MVASSEPTSRMPRTVALVLTTSNMRSLPTSTVQLNSIRRIVKDPCPVPAQHNSPGFLQSLSCVTRIANRATHAKSGMYVHVLVVRQSIRGVSAESRIGDANIRQIDCSLTDTDRHLVVLRRDARGLNFRGDCILNIQEMYVHSLSTSPTNSTHKQVLGEVILEPSVHSAAAPQ
jgi:hypothetical protein